MRRPLRRALSRRTRRVGVFRTSRSRARILFISFCSSLFECNAYVLRRTMNEKTLAEYPNYKNMHYLSAPPRAKRDSRRPHDDIAASPPPPPTASPPPPCEYLHASPARQLPRWKKIHGIPEVSTSCSPPAAAPSRVHDRCVPRPAPAPYGAIIAPPGPAPYAAIILGSTMTICPPPGAPYG